MGADSGGAWPAAMYTLIGTARHYGIDPEAFLHYVPTHIAEQPINRINNLRSWNVAAVIAKSSPAEN